MIRRLALALLLSSLAACGHSATATDSGALPDTSRPDAAPAQGIRTVLNEGYVQAVHQLIDGAKTTLKVAHFMINKDSAGDEIVKKLGAAAARGVKVQVVLENSVDDNPGRVSELKKLGANAKLDESTLYTHAKLVVADGARALLGSSNFSWSSMYKNNEANLLLTDPALVKFFEGFADAVYNSPASHPSLTAASTALGTAMDDGDYYAQANPMITGAKKRITMVTYGMNLNPKYPDSELFKLAKEMEAAVKRGVTVRVILEQADYNASVNSLNKAAAADLKGRGITVRRDALARITHAKVLICDDKVILGSNNWGYGGFTLYHEVGVATSNAQVVKELSAYLDTIWKNGADM
jgi:cardiolipin synthase A/B